MYGYAPAAPVFADIRATAGPLATIEGFQSPLVPQGTGMSIPKSPPPGLPLLTPQDKAKFARLFQGCGPVNGLLSGTSGFSFLSSG